jgi:peptidoglycan/LPS O-acetylase OafA/YrhL
MPHEPRPRVGPLARIAPSWGPRMPGIEGLRAMAALSILAFHIWLESSPNDGHPDLGVFDRNVLPNLRSGLTLFFALSGFLLYRQFAGAVMRDRPMRSIRGYLTNRGLRILPAYWVILLITALVLQTAVVHDASGYHVGALTDPGVLVRNLGLIQNYQTSTVHTGINPAWTLVVEVAFYLALPLLALAAAAIAPRHRRGRMLAALAPAGVLLVLGVVCKLVAEGPPTNGLAATHLAVFEVSFPYNADRFAFGMAAAVLVIAIEDGWFVAPRWLRPAAFGGALALAAIAIGLDPRAEGRIYDTFIAAACGLVLLYVTAPAAEGRLTRAGLRLLEAPIVVAAGIVSYSLYLWQEPVISWLREHGLTVGGLGGLFVNAVIATVAVGAFAVISYRFVEAPAMRYKSWARGRRVSGERPPKETAGV